LHAADILQQICQSVLARLTAAGILQLICKSMLARLTAAGILQLIYLSVLARLSKTLKFSNYFANPCLHTAGIPQLIY
jgi:hypothetical protein